MIKDFALAAMFLFLLAAIIGLIIPSFVMAKGRASGFVRYLCLAFISFVIFGIAHINEGDSRPANPVPVVEPQTNEQQSEEFTPAELTAQNTRPAIPVSDAQKRCNKLIAEYAEQYKAAPNQLKKSALVPKRDSALKALIRNGTVDGFIGVIESMSTTSEGNAALLIRLVDSNIRIGTWNNIFSDITDKTLIPQTSALYKTLAEMQEGNVVRFSGPVAISLRHKRNLTEEGWMTEPEFLIRFKSVEKIADAE